MIPEAPAPPAEAEAPPSEAPFEKAQPWGLLPPLLARMAGDDQASRARFKTRLVQVLIFVNVFFATRYIVWRAFFSINWHLWPFGVALYSAEMFSYIDCLFFALTVWQVRHRDAPPPPVPDLTVDVFVTTYNEDVELVRKTAIAARDIAYPHQTWVLDDGRRPAMQAAAEEIGVGYIVRNGMWQGKNNHAKAGNLINAMYQTSGEFILVLDADQVPHSSLLDRVMGYFRDPNVAFVQTPQWFGNTPAGDPFGSDAPLFYGPIQAGKDGWNSAFFCGSNAVLRREALMRVGIVWYARGLQQRVRAALNTSRVLLRLARRGLPIDADPRARQAIEDVLEVVREARHALKTGKAVQGVTWEFQRALERVSKGIVLDDLARIRADLAEIQGAQPDLAGWEADTVLSGMSSRERSPLGALTAVRSLITGIDMDIPDEAEPVLPLSTVSVTEDMATAMRLHGLGWTSVYHHEILAVGLAPEDLQSSLQQRLRWAQGTLQVMFRENPLWQPGLSWPQRLLYFGTMWSYLSGFAALVYLVSPVLYLLFGWMPVKAYSLEFFGYLAPYLLGNQILFVLIGWGLSTWRGQQYSLALFPVWIQAVFTTIGNVFFGRKLGFIVTPKTRQRGLRLDLIWAQLLAMALLAGSIVVGFIRLATGMTDETGPILINAFWAGYDLLMLSVVVRAVTWRPEGE
jgi:cellulose synthase (UDP-forming)